MCPFASIDAECMPCKGRGSYIALKPYEVQSEVIEVDERGSHIRTISDRLSICAMCWQDAVVAKLTESPLFLMGAGLVGFLLFAPLVLSLWRFALFGLD